MKTSTILLAAALIFTACNHQNTNIAEGSFEATEITISAETAGKILSINVDEGSQVTKGETLAVIDTLQLSLQLNQLECQRQAILASRPDIAQQEASIRQQIVNASTERDRIARLLADNAATQKQLDNANQQIAALGGQLTGLSSQLSTQTTSLNRQAETIQAQMDMVRDQLDRCRIIAPCNATVLTKYQEPGEMTAPGKPILKIADLNHIYLRAYLTSRQLSDVKLGQEVTVTAMYGDGVTQEYKGKIISIASTSEFTPKTIQTDDSRANLVYAVKIAVENDGKLKIGLQGTVDL